MHMWHGLKTPSAHKRLCDHNSSESFSGTQCHKLFWSANTVFWAQPTLCCSQRFAQSVCSDSCHLCVMAFDVTNILLVTEKCPMEILLNSKRQHGCCYTQSHPSVSMHWRPQKHGRLGGLKVTSNEVHVSFCLLGLIVLSLLCDSPADIWAIDSYRKCLLLSDRQPQPHMTNAKSLKKLSDYTAYISETLGGICNLAGQASTVPLFPSDLPPHYMYW